MRATASTAAQSPSGDEVRAAIDEIFARPEFQERVSPIDNWIERLIDAIGRWLRGTGVDPAAAGEVAGWIVYGVLIAIGLFVVFLLARALAQRRAPRSRGEAHPRAALHEGRRMARDLCAEARAAHERGDHRQAVLFYFRALVLGLSEHGHLVYKDSWTNRELIERGAPPRALQTTLTTLLPRLDAQSFGHVPTLSTDVERWAGLVRQHLPGLHA